MSSDGSTPSSTGSCPSRSAASTAPSSVDSVPSGNPSPSVASSPASSVASSPASSAASTPASSVTSTHASTAPSSPAGSRAPSPTPKSQPQSQLSEPQPTCEVEIPDNDALHLLLEEIERYSVMKVVAEHQTNTARKALGIRDAKKNGAPRPGDLPLRFHQLTEKEREKRVDRKFEETLQAIIKMAEKYKDGMYDHDYYDSFGDKSRPHELGYSGVYWNAKVSQSITNENARKVDEWKVNDSEHDPVASQAFTSSTTNGHLQETTAMVQMESAVSVLASLVATVNPYDKDDKFYSQFTPSFQKLIKDGYDMVDHSPKTPWPAGEQHYHEQKREGLPSIFYKSAMRKPAVFDTVGMGESNEIKSLRTHFDTVATSSPAQRKHFSEFARSAGFGSTNRDSTDTQNQTAQTTAFLDSGPSNNGLSNPSNKPRRVSIADQSQTADTGPTSDGRPQRTEDWDKNIREEFDKFRRRQAGQTPTSCAQEAGISQTELAQTGSLASYG